MHEHMLERWVHACGAAGLRRIGVARRARAAWEAHLQGGEDAVEVVVLVLEALLFSVDGADVLRGCLALLLEVVVLLLQLLDLRLKLLQLLLLALAGAPRGLAIAEHPA